MNKNASVDNNAVCNLWFREFVTLLHYFIQWTIVTWIDWSMEDSSHAFKNKIVGE